jgi:two-component system sensor kinase
MPGQSPERHPAASKNAGGHRPLHRPLIAAIAGTLLFLAGGRFLAARRTNSSPAAVPQPLGEARLLGIIRSSMDAIITIDADQRIVMLNPMAEKLFGCEAAEALGTSLTRFMPERFRAAHAGHVRQFGITGVTDRQMGGRTVLYGLRSNGEEFPIEASISQIDDASGKLYTVMLRDVTARVEAERSLQRSHEELRELSANLLSIREEEKTRIARELHDDLGQQLTALKMDVSSLELAPGMDAQARMQLRGMQRLIDATVGSMRRIAADLRPVMLDDLGLIPAVEWLANDFSNRYGTEVEWRTDRMNSALNRDGSTAVFRIVQEALTNVARHAQAAHVALELRQEGDLYIVRIADDGRGADELKDGARKSFGLIGIRERANRLGGSVVIETAPGQGFCMTVTLPLAALQEDGGFAETRKE